MVLVQNCYVTCGNASIISDETHVFHLQEDKDMMIRDSCEIAVKVPMKKILHFLDDKSTAEVCFIAEPAYIL